MTKKHFEAVAKRIRSDIDETRENFPAKIDEILVSARYAADIVAMVAAADNPRFDRARFMTACGL